MTEQTGKYAIEKTLSDNDHDQDQNNETPLDLESFIRKAIRMQRGISLEPMQFPDGCVGFYLHNTAYSGECMDYKVRGDSIEIVAIGHSYVRDKNEA